MSQIKPLALAFAFILVLLVPSVAQASPPTGPAAGLPGLSRGKAHSYWLAPFVRCSEETIGQHSETTLTWFTQDGKIKRHASISSVEPGFASTISRQLPGPIVKGPFPRAWLARHEFKVLIRGVNEDWKISLPHKTGPAGYITSTPDSRVFVHEFHPQAGQLALDIYLHGKLAGTVGPFVQHLDAVHLNEDGSAALVVWKDETKTTLQVVALDSTGGIRFRVDCQLPVASVIAAPGGTGVLLCKGGEAAEGFDWYTQEGKLRSVEVGPNPVCAGWAPGTWKALFSTSTGEEERYSLIDWSTGTRLWKASCPAKGKVLAIGFTENYVLFAVAELYKPGPLRGPGWSLEKGGKEWIRAFYALKAQDGTLAARWQSELPAPFPADEQDRFLRLHGRLFFLTPGEFVEFSEADITARTNGWQ